MKLYHHNWISWLLRTRSDHRIETIKAHSTSLGCTAIIRDKKDGKKYVMTINPIKTKEELQAMTAEELLARGGI